MYVMSLDGAWGLETVLVLVDGDRVNCWYALLL
uniref:Uncharacterized protein n=1 Tax=Arundo donax TaxID=35708 RepID=A0A0A9E0D1_ARUDO